MISETFIGSGFIQGTPAGAYTIAAYNQTAGHCIVVLTNTYSGAGSSNLLSVTDTAGNTYVKQISGQGFTSGNSTFLQVWIAKNCIGNAANVISVNYSSNGTFGFAGAYDVSGADVNSPLDVLVTNSGSSTAAASASYTTAFNNEVLLAMMGTENGYLKADSVDSGFNLDAGEIGGSGTGGAAVASKTVSSIQTGQVVTFTLHATNPWNVVLISITEPRPNVAKSVVIIFQ